MAATMASHISDYVLKQDDSKAADIARDLYKRDVTLVQVVESLGQFLTSPVVEQRRRGTQLMASILQKLPSDFLVEKEVGHVTAFLVSKLSDHHSIQPLALHGLAAATGYSAFSDGDESRRVCSEIFKEVQNQSLSQADRRATYTIFLNLLTSHLPDLQALGDTFVCGYVQQMDGEKDPRNLILAFRCSTIICQHFSLGPMEEDMFEVNSCYFPIDFVPPPNDPHGITRGDLSETLCGVMSATPAFAQFCYPLLMEKLTSDVTSAKLDSLKTLCACLPIYGTRHLQEYLGSLTTQVMREVRAGSPEDVVEASLHALTAIAAQVSQVPQQLGEFMAETGANLVRQVESENLAARMSSTRILCTMASASPLVCHAVASRLVPVVCSVCQKLSQLEQHTAFFTEVSSLLQHIADAQSSKTALDWSLLQDFRGKLQEVCDRLLASKDSQLQVLGMRGLCALSAWGAVFTADEISCTAEKMMTRALTADTDDLREEGVKALSKVARQQAQLCDGIISHLSQVLQNNLALYDACESRKMFDNSAALLAAVAVDDVTGVKVCQALLRLLQAFQTGYEECMVPVSNSLASVLVSGHLPPQFLVSTALSGVLGFLWSGCRSWSADKQHVHVTVLSTLVRGLCCLVLLLDSQASQSVVGMICSVVIKGNNSGGDHADASPLKATSPWQLSRLVQLLLAVIPRLDVKKDDVWEQLVSQLPDLALQTEDTHTHQQACRCLAALVNRMPAGEWLDSTVRGLCTTLTPTLTKRPHADLDLQHRTLNLLTWLVKAVVVRGHKLSSELTGQLTGLLSDQRLGPKAAEGFCIILAPFPEVLCAEVNANITPTFQQRFLIQNLAHLLDGFQNAQSEVKENYLLAVAGMLTNVPQQVLVAELPKLMPVLVSSLKGSNSSLHVQALATLTAGIRNMPELMTYYLSDILPDCLMLATQAANMRVRILAVQCVGAMIHLPSKNIQPHKTQVVNKLKSAIDDRKRLVRKEAAQARNVWCLL